MPLLKGHVQRVQLGLFISLYCLHFDLFVKGDNNDIFNFGAGE